MTEEVQVLYWTRLQTSTMKIIKESCLVAHPRLEAVSLSPTDPDL